LETVSRLPSLQVAEATIEKNKAQQNATAIR